ncbi:MAG: ATP-binding protein [Deltaproteobacteria bacterium]|jgi:predicted AAA+ superfamily ATPase|nr:ATP-binding protein [Deltaproteobacteria bacterium]
MTLDSDLKDQLRRVLTSVEQVLPRPIPKIDWSQCMAANWRQHKLNGFFEALSTDDSLHLDTLLGIDRQKTILEGNTLQFLAGYPANNALLWGTRGTGKSSLIKAMLNRYSSKGLRIIQVDKDDLHSLPEIFIKIKDEPYRFIIFCDDLSFDSGEKGYKILKSTLDGSMYTLPKNSLIYVTSNRRYLIPEYATDNLGAKMVNNEVHHGEGVEEKVSLSDRFGLWVAFHVFSQEQYLQVVKQSVKTLCADHNIQPTWDRDVEQAAIAWANEKSKQCGRTANQFARRWVGQKLLFQER